MHIHFLYSNENGSPGFDDDTAKVNQSAAKNDGGEVALMPGAVSTNRDVKRFLINANITGNPAKHARAGKGNSP